MQIRTVMPQVFVMTDDVRLPDPVAVAQALPSHWGLILRHYETSNRHQLARELATVCKARGLILLIAADWRLACDVDADGVHMPEALVREQTISPVLNATRSRLLTTSAHGQSGLRLAASIKADGVFLSPVKRTKSHSNAAPLGVLPFAAMARQSRVPVYALGGIEDADAQRFQALGAAGIAGISLAGEKL